MHKVKIRKSFCNKASNNRLEAKISSTGVKSIQNVAKKQVTYMVSKHHSIYHLLISNIEVTSSALMMRQLDSHMPHNEML